MKKTMFEILSKYSHTGQFEFHIDDNLRYVCNAPTDKRRITIKGVFPSDTALEKLVYLAYRNISEKWTMPLAN